MRRSEPGAAESMKGVEELADQVGKRRACQVLKVPRSSLCRARQPAKTAVLRPRLSRALSSEEQREVMDLLHSPRFVDCAPISIWANLLDQGC